MTDALKPAGAVHAAPAGPPRRSLLRAATLGALAGGVAPFASARAQGAAAGKHLTIGAGAPATSIDPHFYNASPNNSIAQHIFDFLTMQDSKTKVRPALAESWKTISDTVWEFKLRPNVTWHDGKPFTADDVVFTVGRVPNVPNSPGGFGGYVRSIKQVEVLDPLTIRLHTADPHPLLPIELAGFAIIARHAAEGASTEDFNSGKAAIGTGPYRFVSFRPGDRVQLARNERYWGGVEPWSTVDYRFILNDGTRTAALLSGDVDLIDQVPSSDLPRLKKDPRLTVSQVQGVRLIYIAPDFSRTGEEPFVSDNDGKKLPKNPFLDIRVRRALTMAINRQALAERIMEGTAEPTGQWLPPGTFGYNPDVRPPAFDPEGAKKLLAEAGFPQGFRLTLHSPNDRYPNDARTAQAVAQMWSRIGVKTEVEAIPWASFAGRSSRQEFSIRLTGWGSATGEATYALLNILGTYDPAARRGATNAGRYSNPALDALSDKASATLDDAEREKLEQQAVQMVADEAPIFPLYELINSWALRKGLTYDARMDERTSAMGVREG